MLFMVVVAMKWLQMKVKQRLAVYFQDDSCFQNGCYLFSVSNDQEADPKMMSSKTSIILAEIHSK